MLQSTATDFQHQIFRICGLQEVLATILRLLIATPDTGMAANWPSAAEAAVSAVYALSNQPQQIMAAVLGEMFERCRPGEPGTRDMVDWFSVQWKPKLAKHAENEMTLCCCSGSHIEQWSSAHMSYHLLLQHCLPISNCALKQYMKTLLPVFSCIGI